MSWTPKNPDINDHDILRYSEYLAKYAQAKRKPKYFCNTIYSFYRDFLANEIIDGRTRDRWKAAHIKRFSILKPGVYPLHYYPDEDSEKDGQVEILSECIMNDMDTVEVSWGAMERYISVDPTHSELDIESLDLPKFSQDLCGNITRN